MKDFKKFVKAEEAKKQNSTTDNEICDNMNLPENMPEISDFDPKDVNMVKNLAEKYQGNQPKLISDIVALAEKNRKEGKLKNSDLDNFENKITPMLNGEQKKMLKKIMGMLKK